MQANDFPRFEEPTDIFYCEDWQGAEIYMGEEYLVFPNGDRVLNFKENILEYMKENWNEALELINGATTRKVAEK